MVHRHVSLYSTQRAYILKNELANLETALLRYTLNYLNSQVNSILFYCFIFTKYRKNILIFTKGFTLVSVPDILHHSIIVSI